eukprot:6920760-Pyramimonas_sp.AAC.1
MQVRVKSAHVRVCAVTLNGCILLSNLSATCSLLIYCVTTGKAKTIVQNHADERRRQRPPPCYQYTPRLKPLHFERRPLRSWFGNGWQTRFYESDSTILASEAGRGPVHSGSVAAEDHQEAGQGGGGGGRTPGEDGLHVDPHQVRNNPSGPLLAELDAPPEKMLSLWSPTRGAGEVDVVFVVEESESMKPGITALTRVLGGGGGNSEACCSFQNTQAAQWAKRRTNTTGEKEK